MHSKLECALLCESQAGCTGCIVSLFQWASTVLEQFPIQRSQQVMRMRQKLCKAEGKQVAGGKLVPNNAYICGKPHTMQRMDFLLAADSNAGTNKIQMHLGEDKQQKQQAEGAYQGCQHSVAVVESAHEVGVHVEHGAVSCPVTIMTIIHLHSRLALNPKSSDLSAFDYKHLCSSRIRYFKRLPGPSHQHHVHFDLAAF